MAQFTIRIPDEMRDRIKESASADKRSMNGQIEWLLQHALEARESNQGELAMSDGISRAYHDINGVTTIRVVGWRGPYAVTDQPEGEHGVAVLSPKRHEEEFWTFAKPGSDGVLHCHTSLLGSPSLLARDVSAPLVVRLPADRIGQVHVTVAARHDPQTSKPEQGK